MKRKYRILTLILTMGLLFINSEFAMAATGLSEEEELILERLSEGVEMNGIKVIPPASYLYQIENELMKNEVDITPEQATVINHKIDEAVELVKDVSIEDLEHFKNSDTAKKLISLVEEATVIADYTVSIDIVNGTINVVNSEGNYVFMAKSVINQTGFDMTQTVIVGCAMITILAAGIVMACKMKLFVKTVKA